MIPLGVLASARVAASGPAPPSGMSAWWKADSLSLSDNDPVASWADSSGSGNTATSSSSSYEPTYKTSIRNGLPVVRFAGTTAAKQHLNTPASASTAAVTMCLVLDHQETAGIASTFLGSTLTGGWQADIIYPQGLRLLRQYAALVGQRNVIMANGWYYITVRYSSPTWTLRVNGVAVTGSTAATPTAGRTFVIGRNPGGGNIEGTANGWFKGDIGEIVVYPSALSDTDVTAAESYITTKWGF